MQQNTYHTPVLFHEAIDALNIQPGGVYADCTFGGGGHAKGILDKLNEHGKLIAFDQDGDAKKNLPADERIIFVHQNFRHLSRFLRLHKIERLHGLLADLGVSSYQFDKEERGFSTRFASPLDMRMNQAQQLTAADVLLTYSESQLHALFEKYGEVTNAKTLARHIIQHRNPSALSATDSFRSLLKAVIKGNPNKYLAQVFQALRIEVNDELGALKELLEQIPEALMQGGRCAVITFHSIEDRMVKNFFRSGSFEESDETNPFSNETKKSLLKVITKKTITPSEDEMKKNPRSRSAKLRVAERI